MIDLRPFQKRFIRQALKPGIDTAALSIPRGNGKSALAGHILTRVLDPDDVLFRPGTESVLGAASIEQARVVYRFVRADLEGRPGYRFLDSHTRIGVTHVPTNTRLRVISSNAKTAFGLVNTPYAVLDEPGSFEVVGGQLLWDAVQTAQGKPGSPFKIIIIGTLAPAMSGWWHDLVEDGSRGSTYVQALRGDPERWDSWHEIRRCNPLTAISADFRKKLLEERDEARKDSRLKARFLSYRLNVPSGDESTMLLTVDDWERVVGRPVPPREGRPITAYDLGGGRAWSAAVACWKNGRVGGAGGGSGSSVLAGAGEAGPGADWNIPHAGADRRPAHRRGLEGATPCPSSSRGCGRLGVARGDPVRPLPTPGTPGRREWNANHAENCKMERSGRGYPRAPSDGSRWSARL